jgi:hypothetical protein
MNDRIPMLPPKRRLYRPKNSLLGARSGVKFASFERATEMPVLQANKETEHA